MRLRALLAYLLAVAAHLSTGAPLAAQTIYFHSPSEQEETANLATSLDAARTAHLAALDHHDADLKAAMEREQAAIVRLELASRDAVLSRHLAGDSQKLVDVLDARVSALGSNSLVPTAGSPAPIDPQTEARMQADLSQVRQDRLVLDALREELRRTVALAALRGEPALVCDETKPPPSNAAASNPAVANVCLDLHQTYSELVRFVPCSLEETSRTILASAAGVRACWDGQAVRALIIGGQIGTAFAEHEQLGKAIAQQQQAAALVTKELTELESYIGCEKQKANAPAATARIAAAAARLDLILKVATGEAPPDLDEATAAAQTVLPVCERDKQEPARPDALGDVLDTFRVALQGAQAFDATRSIAAAAAAEAQTFRANKLGEILQAAALTDTPADGPTAAIVSALVRSTGPLETLAQVEAGTLPDTSGALVALAEARMRATTARLEAERLTQLEALAEKKVTALVNEAILAQRSLTALRTPPDADRGVVLYAASVERGRIPAEVIAAQMDNVAFDVWARRERAVVEAGYSALAPAALELKAYGEGGIRPDTIAQLLNVAGLAAIAGTN